MSSARPMSGKTEETHYSPASTPKTNQEGCQECVQLRQSLEHARTREQQVMAVTYETMSQHQQERKAREDLSAQYKALYTHNKHISNSYCDLLRESHDLRSSLAYEFNIHRMTEEHLVASRQEQETLKQRFRSLQSSILNRVVESIGFAEALDLMEQFQKQSD